MPVCANTAKRVVENHLNSSLLQDEMRHQLILLIVVGCFVAHHRKKIEDVEEVCYL